MNAKWTWIFGIAGGVSLVLTGYLYFATQTVTLRDWFVFGLGVIVGAMVAGFVATFILYAPGRQATRDRERTELQAQKDGHAATLQARKHESEAVAARKAALITALPLRTERLAEIKTEIAQNKIDLALADGNQKSQMYEAQNAMRVGYNQFAAENLANAQTWNIKQEHLIELQEELEAQRAALTAQTDDEYLAEQIRLRGLD